MTEARYKLSEELLDRGIGDDLLVHRFDNDEVFVLNAHARMVFDAVKAGGTLADICAHIVAKGFGAAEDLAAAERALREMVDQGIAIVETG
jgi:hypothetical protein